MKRFGLVILFLQTSLALAADAPEWSVQTGDFQTHVGSLQSMTADEVTLHTADNADQRFPLRNVLRLDQDSVPPIAVATETFAEPEISVGQTLKIYGVQMTITSTNAIVTTLNTADGQSKSVQTSTVRQVAQANAARNRRRPLALLLNNGDLILGQPVAIDGSKLTWSNDTFGSLSIPLEQLRQLVRFPNNKLNSTGTPTEDTVLLANGDSVHGILSGVSGTTLTLQPATGDATNVALDSVQQVSFAQTTASPAKPAHAFAVSISDGSRLTVGNVVCHENQCLLTKLDGTATTLPEGSVRQIEQIGGPVVWLSDLTPVESISRSFLTRAWPAQMDRSVDGEALRFEAREFRHGIGVHAYSKLTFEVPDGFERFHVSYAIDGDAPYADATVRILLDGKVAMEAAHVCSGQLTTPPALVLKGAKRISLEVDFGDRQDVQDRLNWIEPALIRAEQ